MNNNVRSDFVEFNGSMDFPVEDSSVLSIALSDVEESLHNEPNEIDNYSETNDSNEELLSNSLSDELSNTEDFDELQSQEADNDSYEQGYKAGYEAGLSENVAVDPEVELAKLQNQVADKLLELSNTVFLDQTVVAPLSDMVIKLTKALIQKEIETDPQIISSTVQSLVSQLVERSNIQVECSAHDLPNMPEIPNAVVTASPQLESGEFKLVSAGQKIDSTYKHKVIAIIQDALNVC
ncbi:hypothetical protein I3271_03195 [Photobacterium leiognathi]|uniref:FliH/SctL family protein n=1 Tax=Photobacterium leiognathi TaxID=553611 RepID=UPI001EE01ED7|nr:FliH/SctL family protein [Photobacterium leiognathi]MCG3883688.1 hypothetical protein [Photobacterium leiognathi]